LTSSFEGKIDSATRYMKQSAYSDVPVSAALKELFVSKPRNIVIYAHDFYDSPHQNRMLQFPDFYQWLKQTLEALTDLKDTNVFIKTHPNGYKGSKEKAIELVNHHGKSYFHIIDESVSNLNIIQLKPDLVVTARGTVGLEMAWFEIPVVALFDNLYANFNFVHTCPDKESYFAVIKGEQKPEIDFDKKKICSFYYQAYLERTVLEENSVFDMFLAIKQDTYTDNYMAQLSSPENLMKIKSLDSYYKVALSNA
jgi:hypothetical protein